MPPFVRLWPWIWLALAVVSIKADGGEWVTAIVGGVLLGSILSMVGLYLNVHVTRRRWRIPAVGAVLGLAKAYYQMHHGSPHLTSTGFLLYAVLGILVGCLLRSLIDKLPGQAPKSSLSSSDATSWTSLGLTNVTSQGATALAIRGRAEALREVAHGGGTEQYLEFDPSSRYLVAWTPDRLELFSVDTGESMACLSGPRGFVGFSKDGTTLFAVDKGMVASYRLPKLTLAGRKPLTHGNPDWVARSESWVSSRHTGLTVSAEDPNSSLDFPYHLRIHDGKDLRACPGPHCAILIDRQTNEILQSDDVAGDVTALGFSAGGEKLAFATMRASVFIADTTTLQLERQMLVDGEVRCLAVSGDGLVAVGCADLSSKVWVFHMETGSHAHLIDSRDDTWAVAFSPDNLLIATGHENGKAAIWKRSRLPCPQWIKVRE